MFANLRKSPRAEPFPSRATVWRRYRTNKANHTVIRNVDSIYHTPDDKTMLSEVVTDGWLKDTSKITKPLLEGAGELNGRIRGRS